jgi:hypothetical protein
MADGRRGGVAFSLIEDGWEVKESLKPKSSRSPPPSLSLSSGMLGGHVPMDLVECCFNCFAEDHVTAHCPTEA